MPTSMLLLAEAAGAAATATAKATAVAATSRLDTDGLPAEGREHPSEPLLQLDLRLPAENLLRPRDVGLAHLGIVDRQRFVDDLARRAGHALHRLGQLVQREFTRVAEVDRQVL